MNIKPIIFLSVLLISWGVHAHQTHLSSTTLVEQGKNNWALQVRAALTAFEYEVERNFGDSAYSTPEEFKNLTLTIVQDNLLILLNNTDTIGLKNGTVTLGHETSVTFQLTTPLTKINYLTIQNSCFNTIARNKNLLFILKEGYPKSQFTLSDENSQTIHLKAIDNDFVVLEPTISSFSMLTWIAFVAVIAIIAIAVSLFRTKKKVS
tara:strand:+ start:151 stop:771 length:621 start_codon:yes stop_codon:yes gene_type:complete